MSATDGVRALILTSTIATSIDNIDILSAKTIAGELERFPPQNIITISPTERKYEFYLTELEAIGDLIGMSLYGNGATVALGDGTEMATSVVSIEKTGSQSLLIYWTVKVVAQDGL